MNCTSCGANLPPGAASCPLCGNPAPYNVSAPSGSHDPTIAAPSSYDPTVAASPYGTQPPPPASSTPPYSAPTAYGSPAYGAPPNPPDPYGGSNAYVPPPPLVQQPVYPGQFGSQMQGPQQKPKSKLPLILGIVGGVVLLLCIGACALIYAASKNAPTTNTGTPTTTTGTTTTTTGTTPAPTTGSTPASNTTGPSGQTIVPAAAAIITDAQSTSSIDSNYKPTNPTTTFKVNQTVYITFNLHLTEKGYAEVKWYVDGTFGKSRILPLQSLDYVDAYFSETYLKPANGTAELYWCTQSDCSDAQLAAVVNFTITSSSSIQPPTTATIAGVMDVDRRV